MNALNSARGLSVQIQIRTGAPAVGGNQGTVLAQLTGNAAGWGSVAGGVLTANAITADNNAGNAGIAGHYQLNTSGGTYIESGLLDGSDGVTIDNVNIALGQTVQLAGDWVNTAAYDDV